MIGGLLDAQVVVEFLTYTTPLGGYGTVAGPLGYLAAFVTVIVSPMPLKRIVVVPV